MSGAAIIAFELGGATGGGSGGGDVTPAAIAFTNANGSIFAVTNTQTISAINSPITLQVSRTGVGYLSSIKNGTVMPLASGGTISLINGDTLAFGVTNGVGSTITGTVTVTNLSDGSTVLATFTYAVTRVFF